RGKRGDEDIKLADDAKFLDFWKEVWAISDYSAMAKKILGAADVWEQNLDEDDNAALVSGYIESIVKNGERAALKAFLGE
ncbi:MAG: tagaturonate reductase, partial [Oscillospiraceae bacterium]